MFVCRSLPESGCSVCAVPPRLNPSELGPRVLTNRASVLSRCSGKGWSSLCVDRVGRLRYMAGRLVGRDAGGRKIGSQRGSGRGTSPTARDAPTHTHTHGGDVRNNERWHWSIGVDVSDGSQDIDTFRQCNLIVVSKTMCPAALAARMADRDVKGFWRTASKQSPTFSLYSREHARGS